MEFVRTQRDSEILVVSMARGKANALNATMVEELNEAVDQGIADETVRGIVLASDSRSFFSGGFDVKEVFAYDREVMRTFFGRFIDLYENLSHSPKPVIAAINGHAFAGGAVLAVATDVRVFSEGTFGYSLNEVNLGVVLPPGIMRMAINAVGIRNAGELLLSGRIIKPAEPSEIGLANEIAKPDDLLNRAIGRARELGQKPPQTFRAIKCRLQQMTRHETPGSDRDVLDEFIESWFSQEATAQKRALIESLA